MNLQNVDTPSKSGRDLLCDYLNPSMVCLRLQNCYFCSDVDSKLYWVG